MSQIGDLLSKETAGLPNWAWVAVIAVGGGVGYLFVHNQGVTNAGTTTVSADGQTDTSQAGINAVSQPSDTNYTLSSPSGANPGSPVYVLSQSPSPQTTNTVQQVTVREKESSGPYVGYDTKNPGGVPIRSGTSGNTAQLRQAPYGSTLNVTGPAVVGGSNVNGSGGSVYWYPVQGGGYISSSDVVGIGGGGSLNKNKTLAL